MNLRRCRTWWSDAAKVSKKAWGIKTRHEALRKHHRQQRIDNDEDVSTSSSSSGSEYEVITDHVTGASEIRKRKSPQFGGCVVLSPHRFCSMLYTASASHVTQVQKSVVDGAYAEFRRKLFSDLMYKDLAGRTARQVSCYTPLFSLLLVDLHSKLRF